MRRKKIKFGGPAPPPVVTGTDELGRQAASTGSSDVDPSSSEQSADTVIYVGPADGTATDGEHPPVYIPSLNSGDNRCAMSKALRGSSAEMRSSPRLKHCSSPAKSVGHRPTEGSPLKTKPTINSAKSSPTRTSDRSTRGKDEEGKVSHGAQATRHEEQWIDGPRISKQKVQEARNILLNEHIKQETWIDGPMQKPSSTSKPSANTQACANYGFMDNHKKSMIRKWVENQTVQMKHTSVKSEQTGISRSSEPVDEIFKPLTSFKGASEESAGERGTAEGCPILTDISSTPTATHNVSRALIKQTDACLKNLRSGEAVVETSKDAAVGGGSSEGSSEEDKLPPPPLPLLLRYDHNKMDVQSLSRLSLPEGMDEYEDEEIELEIVEISETDEPVPMQDSCLQVTEEDIALCMGEGENPLPEVDQGSQDEHPLRILSQENLTIVSTFTDSMSATHEGSGGVSQARYGTCSLMEAPLIPPTFRHDDYIDVLTRSQLGSEPLQQLARLHQLYRSKLAMTSADRNARCQSLSLTDMLNIGEPEAVINGNCSIYSEPPYRLPDEPTTICNSCRQHMPPSQAESSSRLNFSSLRHPDGASNPNLDEGQRSPRLPGNGASKSDYEEELHFRHLSKKRTNSESRKSSRDIKPSSQEVETAKLSDNCRSHQNSPSRRGTLSKTKMFDLTTSGEKMSSVSSSPPPQKHLYLNKGCNEGYDSGHDSTSPKTPKLPRPRAQVQCESSGYESVVSFNSSLDSELGVKLIKEDSEEIHDPGAHSAWWCWCVSGPATTARGPRRAPRRALPPCRGPLTVPPSASAVDKRSTSSNSTLAAIDSRAQKGET